MNTRSAFRPTLLAVAIAAAAGAAVAQEATPLVESTPAWRVQQQAESNAIRSSEPTNIGQTYSAKRLMGADVRGADGRKLGEVRNVVVDAGGQIDSIVVSSSGFLGIGKTRFVVPWQEAKLSGPDLKSVDVPLTKDSVARLSPFDDDDLKLPADSHRGSDLVGHWISLQNGQVLGRVDDLLFDRDGRMQYVVVNGDAHHGSETYAYPYRARSTDSAYVGMPYERPTASELVPFNYGELEQGARVASAPQR